MKLKDAIKALLKQEPNLVYTGYNPNKGTSDTQADFIGLTAQFIGGGDDLLNRLNQDYKREFPRELEEYLTHFAPVNSVDIPLLGVNFTLIGCNQFSSVSYGYNWDDLKKEPIGGWEPNWFLIGQDDGDPFIVNLDYEDGGQSPIWSAFHGSRRWDFRMVARSIAAFLAGELEA